MIEIFSAILLVIGAFFMGIAALGVLKFPDTYSRMHAATKAVSFGAGLMFLSAALYFNSLLIWIKVSLIISFIFLTIPVASNMIGRAAYLLQVPLWKGSVIDEMQDKYNFENRTLS